jgi:hypothetical protein
MSATRVKAVDPRGWFKDRPCAICDHVGDDHSTFLDGACLQCDCDAYMWYQHSDPAAYSGWRCPLCGDDTEGWGTERRRVGRWPWKRMVHIECGSQPKVAPR